MKDYMKRYAMFLEYCKSIGMTPGTEHKYSQLVYLDRFNLDWGLIYLHLNAFTSAI